MILYTPLSHFEIYPTAEEQDKFRHVSHQGKMLYVKQIDDGSYEILQLLSTNPQDFLDTSYTPGNIFKN